VKPQFRIRAIFVLMVCIALLASVSVRIIQNQPPHWKPYTNASLQTALDQNRPVLITLSADWDSMTRIHERTAVNSIEAFRTIRDSGLITLRADATNVDPAVMQLMKNNDLISIPAFLLYSPACRDKPIVLKDIVSEEQLLDAIRCNSERSQNKAMDTKDSILRANLR
jgi:suppressor for copper-sensitivity B